jgi:hypothetical protein
MPGSAQSDVRTPIVRRKRKFMKIPPVLAALLFLSSMSLHAAVLISVTPMSQIAATGTAAEVQLRISGLGLDAAPSLGAFDLNIAFNPSLISFTSLSFGDPGLGDQLDLSGTGAVSGFDLPSAGLLEFFEISLDPPAVLDSEQASSFVLVTLRFQANAPGSTSLASTLNSISDSQGSLLDIVLQNGNINVVSTPEPCMIGLFSLAGASMALLARSRKRVPSSQPE